MGDVVYRNPLKHHLHIVHSISTLKKWKNNFLYPFFPNYECIIHPVSFYPTLFCSCLLALQKPMGKMCTVFKGWGGGRSCICITAYTIPFSSLSSTLLLLMSFAFTSLANKRSAHQCIIYYARHTPETVCHIAAKQTAQERKRAIGYRRRMSQQWW